MSKFHIKIHFFLRNPSGRCSIRAFDIGYSIESKLLKTCCKDFEEACDNNFIGIDRERSYENIYFGLNIKSSVSYPGDYMEDWMEISYCPFCGEKIEIKLDESSTILYQKLKKHRHRKTPLFKSLNEILLLIRLNSRFDDSKDKERQFIYKYGMNKFQFTDKGTKQYFYAEVDLNGRKI